MNKRGLFLMVVLFIFLFSVFKFNEVKERDTEEKESFFLTLMTDEPDKGFLRAYEKREFRFPEDHGIHKGFQTEWWYFTGNLQTEKGRRFGYQFTLFRSQLRPESIFSESTFASNAIFMGHFTITDVKRKRFHYFERFARENRKNAYVKNSPFISYLDGWTVYEDDNDFARLENLRLRAAENDIEIDLNMKIIKPFILQGEDGLSKKSRKDGNSSYYYSATRMDSSGYIRTGREEFKVSGLSWMDREWSTSALSKEQEGWDWFSLHLSDGIDLMFYNLRLKSGESDPLSKGVVVYKNGEKFKFTLDDADFKVLDKWKSPEGGIYPAKWRLNIKSIGLDLEIEPYVKDQELDFFIRYWEGAVSVSGLYKEEKISGSGYVELTGYATEDK